MDHSDSSVAPNASGEPARPTIFFSYSRADQQLALPIIQALSDHGYDVWWDGLIESGARFAQQTEDALKQASAVVVLWSATSVTSHWVNDEAGLARDRGVLVPISMDGSVPPIGFRQFQVIDLSRWSGNRTAPEFDRVLRGLAAIVGGTPTARRAAEASAMPTPPALSRRAIIAGATGGAALAAIAGFWAFGPTLRETGPPGIAVLPFENIGGDASRTYFSEGLSAELRAQLSHNAALRVIAQSSSEAAAKDGADAAVIADRLDVAYLLEGNVRWAGNEARIAADLIDAATNSSKWSKTFDLTLVDIFAVQHEIAAAVTAAITSQLAGGSHPNDVGGTMNATAYDLFLRGRETYNHASSEDMDKSALSYFDAAIAADRTFAAAHAARARSLTLIGSLYGDLAETRANYAAALISARRAVALAPTHAESQSTLGFVLSQAQLDIRAARAPFDQARRLGDGDAGVLARFAQFAAQTGRHDDAHDAIARAVTLDPLNPLMLKTSGLISYWSGDFAGALAPFRRALALEPSLSAAYAPLGDALFMLGRLGEALAAYAQESSPLLKETGLAIANFKMGRREPAQVARDRISNGLGTGQVTHYQQAQIAAQWGEADVALAALGAARAAGDSGLVTLMADPLLRPLHRHQGFTDMLKALHFL